VHALAESGRRPVLHAILVGDPPDGLLYARSQEKRCRQVGIRHELHHLPGTLSGQELAERILRLNRDPECTGIMLHLPLPEHIDTSAMQYTIDPYKDVEGVNPANIGFVLYGKPIIAPCTALAVMELIQQAGTKIRGKSAVVVGQGAHVGRPVTLFLLQQQATVTGCHEATVNLAEHTRRADILVVAAGRPHLIGAEHVKPGAVVIDVGINYVASTEPGKCPASTVTGDVDFDAVSAVASAVSPVPGGVGPVTVAILLRNTVEAVRKQIAK
jgi:methylenetetrahydrofolate dehydrogenase (NADP+)/methenyltetrahydrofolate cyclohydrolase